MGRHAPMLVVTEQSSFGGARLAAVRRLVRAAQRGRWSIRAAAYADPQFEVAMQEARDARPGDLIPVPGWPDRR